MPFGRKVRSLPASPGLGKGEPIFMKEIVRGTWEEETAGAVSSASFPVGLGGRNPAQAGSGNVAQEMSSYERKS